MPTHPMRKIGKALSICLMLLVLTLCAGSAAGQGSTLRYISRIAWSPDSTRIALAAGPFGGACLPDNLALCAVQIYDPETNTITDELIGHDSQLVDVSWSPDGTRIASSEGGGRFFVWDVSTGEVITVPILFPPGGGSVFWNPASALIATIVGGGEYATIWDADTGELLYSTLPGHEEPTSSVAWSPDGTQIATSGLDDMIRIYDTTTWTEQTVLGHTASVYWVAWSPDGTRLAGALADGTIHLWDAATAQRLRVLAGHKAAIDRVVWNPASTMLASSGDDATIRFWNVSTGEQLESVQSTEGSIVDIAWSPDGSRLAYVGETTANQGGVPVLISTPPPPGSTNDDGLPAATEVPVTAESERSNPPDPTIQPIDPSEPVVSHLHPTEAIIGMTNGVVFGRYTLDFELIDQFALFDDPATRPSGFNFYWSPDGTKLAVLLYGLPIPPTTTILQVWDVTRAEKLYELPGLSLAAGVAWSPDGTRFAARFEPDRNVRLIHISDAHSGQMLIEMTPLFPPSQIAWSPTNDQLVFEGWHDLQVWDADTGQLLRTPQVTVDGENELVFNPTANRVAFVNLEDTSSNIEIWDTDTGTLVQQLAGHADRVIDFIWDAHGLISSGADDTIRFWDVATGQQIRSIQTGRYPRAELSADGTQLLVDDDTYGIHTRDALTGRILHIFGEFLSDPDEPNIRVFPLASGESLDAELSNQSCEVACFLEIEPGVTTEDDLISILTALDLPYSSEAWGYAKNFYQFDPTTVSNITLESVVVDVRNGIVDNLTISLDNVSVADVLASYGAPEQIVETTTVAILVYPENGLHFLVPKEDPGVTTAILMTEHATRDRVYSAYPLLAPCIEPAEICSIATAPPVPTISTASAEDAITVEAEGSPPTLTP